MIDNTKSIDLYKSIKASNTQRIFHHWHASSIAECPRSHYYKRLGIKGLNDPTAAKVIRWGAGHLLEEMIRPHIEAVYGNTASNARYTDKTLDLTGEFDNLVLADNRLVEIKSVHDMAFIERGDILGLKEKTGTQTSRTGKETNTWGIKKSPYLHHELQNHAYVLLLQDQGITITGIDYVYISLSGRICVYSTAVQPELLKNVTDRLSMLNQAWQTKTPPPCICTPDHPLYDGVMRWCDYKTETTCCSLKLLDTLEADTCCGAGVDEQGRCKECKEITV